MRTIKFRIWDKGRNAWHVDNEHAVNLFGETIIMGEILRRPDDTGVKISELNDLVPMQFTGLLDKNRKEIYEGDWVRMDRGTCEKNGIAVVSWDETGWSPWINNNLLEGIGFQNEDCEVVGNIYQNPELLT